MTTESFIEKAAWTPVDWSAGRIRLLDQTRLPHEVRYVEIDNWEEVATAITRMIVRGAPAIGCTAALGMALAARQSAAASGEAFMLQMQLAADRLRASRPTAVNLFWAIDRMMGVAEVAAARPGHFHLEEIQATLLDEALAIIEEDIRTNRCLGRHGAALLPDNVNVLTHCNAGALATAGYGTALGVVRAAGEAGKTVHVYADETRPRWQGMKLTPQRDPWLGEVLQRLALSPPPDEQAQSPAPPDYETLATELGMSTGTLRRRFKAATGTSLHNFVLQSRIATARTLLSETDLPLKTIAARLGYNNVYFFSRQFRELAGVSPGHYRKSR